MIEVSHIKGDTFNPLDELVHRLCRSIGHKRPVPIGPGSHRASFSRFSQVAGPLGVVGCR